ncbi:MAG: hypothetical protein IKT46_02455 [Clostridia bacterium]|nr:hypothetical protein [Clostridia bacterium]
MELVNYIGEKERLYGKNGDKSLEYIGITVNNSGIKKKLYQKPVGKNVDEVYRTFPYSIMITKYLSRFTAQKEVSVCDYSESSVNGRHTYRVIFKFPRQLSFEDSKRCIDSFFCDLNRDDVKAEIENNLQNVVPALGFEFSPLLQIGVEFDKDINILGIKYYLNLKASPYERVEPSEAFLEKIRTVFKYKGDDLYRLVQTCRFGYNPIFVGVNVYPDINISEYKIYMISDYMGRDDDGLLENTKKMFSANGWDTVLDDKALRRIHSMDLFVEGIAYTLDRADEYRLYLNYLPRRR